MELADSVLYLLKGCFVSKVNALFGFGFGLGLGFGLGIGLGLGLG